MRDIGDDRALARHHRVFRREQRIDAERLHEPALLVLRAVAGAGHRAGMADGTRQLGSSSGRRRRRRPACRSRHHARNSRRARHTAPRRASGRRCEAHARSRARRSGYRRPCPTTPASSCPSLRCQVLGDRRREAARVREDRDRALGQRLVGKIATERTTDADPAPRVGHAEAVAADDVDAGALRHRTDLACIVDRDLFGDDDDLLQLRVDADQFGDAVAHARRRQVDDTGIERMAGIQSFADIVEDRDIADRGLQLLAAAPGRGAEYDIAAGKGVAGRRHLARFAAEDIQHTDAVAAAGQIGQGVTPR